MCVVSSKFFTQIISVFLWYINVHYYTIERFFFQKSFSQKSVKDTFYRKIFGSKSFRNIFVECCFVFYYQNSHRCKGRNLCMIAIVLGEFKNGPFGFSIVGLKRRGKNLMCHLRFGFFTLTDNVKL